MRAILWPITPTSAVGKHSAAIAHHSNQNLGKPAATSESASQKQKTKQNNNRDFLHADKKEQYLITMETLSWRDEAAQQKDGGVK